MKQSHLVSQTRPKHANHQSTRFQQPRPKVSQRETPEEREITHATVLSARVLARRKAASNVCSPCRS